MIDNILLDLAAYEATFECDDNPLLEDFWLSLIESIHDMQSGSGGDDIEEDWTNDDWTDEGGE